MTSATASVVRTRLDVPMRDGVLLATDVYSASPLDGAAPLAALLERTPYGIRDTRFSDGLHGDGTAVTPESGAEYFVDRGFVVVRQDCRGRGDSEGTFTKYLDEPEDGFDTVSWLREQPWCTGRVVTSGVSYSAHVQTAAAALGAPIAAMILDSGGFADAYETGGRFGGAFELKQAMWAYRHALSSPAVRQDPALRTHLENVDLGAWFERMPWRAGESPLASLPDVEAYLFEQWSHEDHDGYWKQPALFGKGSYEEFPAAPTLNISSWYDPYIRTAIDNYAATRARGIRADLVLGPWTHGARSRSWAGDVDFGTAAPLDGNLATDYLAFKAAWIEQVGSDAHGSGAIDYFLMGGGSGRRTAEGRLDHGGTWLRADSWPPSSVSPTTIHLRADGSLGQDPDGSGSEIRYDFDPRRPVPSLGGTITSGEPLMHGGAFDQTPDSRTFPAGPLLPLASRPDVVAFRTPRLEADVVMAGRAVLELDFSSSAPDTDVSVKIVDEHPANDDYPAGFAMNVTDGYLRVRYRDGFETPHLMEPGQVYRLTIPLADSANLFAKGHRIRVDVSSSNFPRVDVNPNTGSPVVGDRTSRIARNTLHLSHARITLPTVDGE